MMFVSLLQISVCLQIVFGMPIKVSYDVEKFNQARDLLVLDTTTKNESLSEKRRALSLEFYQLLAKNFLHLSVPKSYKDTIENLNREDNGYLKQTSYWQMLINLFRNYNHGHLVSPIFQRL
jgi:hypothetical protein